MSPRIRVLSLCLAWFATACTPTLDWRESRPEGSGLLALFPCKPAAHVRKLMLASLAVEMSLHACSAGGAAYAVGHADVGDPRQVGAALEALLQAAAGNIDATGPDAALPLAVPGMTPNPSAARRAFAGHLGDGRRVDEQVAVFAYGTRVYQATVVAAKLDAEALDTFFGALRLPP